MYLWRLPWTARSSNQSILNKSVLNIHLKDWCWSWNFNSLATWCEELTHWKRLMLGNTEGRRRRGRQKMRWLDGITESIDMILSKPWELVLDRKAWHAVLHGVTKSHTWLSDWTELNCGYEWRELCINLLKGVNAEQWIPTRMKRRHGEGFRKERGNNFWKGRIPI